MSIFVQVQGKRKF